MTIVQQIAKICRRAYDLREASYVPREKGVGHYSLKRDEAMQQAIAESGLTDPEVLSLARMTAGGFEGEFVEWADRILGK